jgi:hypothetical protein
MERNVQNVEVCLVDLFFRMPHIEPFNSSDEEHDVEQREMLHIKMIS